MNFTINSLVTSGFLFLGLPSISGQTSVPEQNSPQNTRICGTESPDQQWERYFQKLIKQAGVTNTGKKDQPIVYTIPVIIHVIHGGQAIGSYPNLAQGQLNSQIQVLNDDYGGIGYNSGNYPATAFTSYAISDSLPQGNLDGLGRVKIANCGIQFCLATKDTLGNILSEPGIERIDYTSKGWANPASFNSINSLQAFINGTVKPQTIWNVSKYLNIWVTDNNVNANNLLGYATFPKLSGLNGISAAYIGSNTTDGFWCYAKVFGSQTIYPSGSYYSGYERGRTSTHEIGHWLGLRHIGGDGNNNSFGDCNATDYCEDTPPQVGGYNSGAFGQNFGSPPYPLFATGVSSCPIAVDGCMFMNFMDYTDDNSKYMYTTDQATRIQTAMANSPYRQLMGTHNLCSVAGIASVSQFKTSTSICQAAVLTLTNTSSGTPVPSYTWSSNGNCSFLPDANSANAVIFFLAGTYVITLTTDNGNVSVSSKTVIVKPSPNLVLTVPNKDVCYGESTDIVASGGTSYYWQPGGISGATMNYQASANQIFECSSTGTNGCTNTVSISMRAVDCTGINSLNAHETNFAIYPNPAQDLVYISSYSEKDKDVFIEISDVSGKMILTQILNLKKEKNDFPLDISSLAKGMYILKLRTDKGATQVIKFVKE